MTRPSVLIADDHDEVRYVLRRVVEAEFDVIGEAANGLDAVRAAEHLQPNVVLLDISMPVMDGFEAARSLRVTVPHLPIIFISNHAAAAYAEEAFSTGALGYVVKHMAAVELCKAIRTVLSGTPFRSSALQ